ncbi:MAG: zinc protease [Candidatus Paceibacteria bacterium]|jgi:zinc protease
MSKQAKKASHNFHLQNDFGDFQVYIHKNNGLTLIHYPIPDTGIVTSNITYRVGSVDEKRGESGIAHMLEHMLFKPTKQDIKKGITSGSVMQFERETGAALNANTAYDRTTYYLAYPKKHVANVLKLEAERMQDVVLDDTEFLPERGNVLSEFDMYNGDPYFALEVAMRSATFQSHAYDHEVIGFREDIEDYTTEKLQRFYEMYYQPNNATLMLIGDISLEEALVTTEKKFGTKKNKVANIHRETAREPAISGPRTVTITRPGTTNILGLGFVCAAFPEQDWYTATLAMKILTDGPESIFHKKFVDTGLVSSLDSIVFPTAHRNVGMLFARLADGVTHEKIGDLMQKEIRNIEPKLVAKLLKKEQVKELTAKAFNRSTSLGVAAELTEYVASNALDQYTNMQKNVEKVTAAQVCSMIKNLLNADTLTTGYYRSV